MTMPPALNELGEIADAIAVLVKSEDATGAVRRIKNLHPADAATIVEGISPELLLPLLEATPNELVAEVIGHLDPETASNTLLVIGVDRRARILDKSEPDVAADVLRRIDWEEARKTLTRMRDLNVVGDLLIHADDDAGGLMSPDFATLRDYWTTRHALSVLRDSDLAPAAMRQIYIVDAQERLVGSLELSELLFASSNTRLREIMKTDVIAVNATDDQEEAVRLAERYQLLSVPVVNRNYQLEGIIAINDLIDVAEQEATEDMFRMFGVSGNLRSTLSWKDSMRNRSPWLILNLFTVMIAGYLISLFEPTLDAMALLAVFLPVVIGQATIAGTQTLTIIVRSLALGERSTASVPKLLIFELGNSIIQGAIVSAILGAIVYIWKNDPALTMLVVGAMMLNLIVAALSGVLVPMMLRLFRIDPAMASAVIVSTATDICGIFMYLGLATLFLEMLT